MSTWPSTLPDVQLTYSAQTGSPRIVRTIMATGRARQRMSATAGWRNQKAQWTMSQTQYLTFQSFHRDTLALGSLPFTAQLAFGNGLVAVVAKFVKGLFQARYQQPYWVVTAELEVVGADYAGVVGSGSSGYITDDAGIAFDDGYGGGIKI